MRNRILFVVIAFCLCLSVLTGPPVFSRSHFATNQEQVITSTSTSVSTSLSASQLIFNGPFTVPSTTGTNLPCEFWTSNFTTMAGEHVSVTGNFTSDNPVNFFVAQQETYQSWVKASTCGDTKDAITSQLTTTSYSFNAAIPNAGTWLIVLVNGSNAKNADGYLVAYLSTLGYSITEVMTLTITPANTSVVSTQPTSSMGPQPAVEIATIGLVVGIAVGLIAIIISRKRKPTPNEKERTEN